MSKTAKAKTEVTQKDTEPTTTQKDTEPTTTQKDTEPTTTQKDTEPTTTAGNTGKAGILAEAAKPGGAKAKILEAAENPGAADPPFDWAKHEQRQKICKAGIWGALGKPFVGFLWCFLSVNHPKVQRAIAHTESMARRAAGLRGATATPADPNPPEVLEQINRAAVIAGTRALKGQVSLGEGNENLHTWSEETPKDGNVRHLSDEDSAIWQHMLKGSHDLVMRALGQMQSVGRAADDEIIKLHATDGVFGRDLVVTDEA